MNGIGVGMVGYKFMGKAHSNAYFTVSKFFDLEAVPCRLEADEVIEPVRVPLAEALDLVWRGELSDAKSALALLYAARRLGRLT